MPLPARPWAPLPFPGRDATGLGRPRHPGSGSRRKRLPAFKAGAGRRRPTAGGAAATWEAQLEPQPYEGVGLALSFPDAFQGLGHVGCLPHPLSGHSPLTLERLMGLAQIPLDAASASVLVSV